MSPRPTVADADPFGATDRTPPSIRFGAGPATSSASFGPCAPPPRRLDTLATHAGETCGPAGLPRGDAPNRRGGARAVPYPLGKRPPIFDAFPRFGML